MKTIKEKLQDAIGLRKTLKIQEENRYPERKRVPNYVPRKGDYGDEIDDPNKKEV